MSRDKLVFVLFLITVPMLFLIGTVLSVLAFSFVKYKVLFFVLFYISFILLLFLFVFFLYSFQKKEKRLNNSLRLLEDVAHELKNPTTVMSGYADLLEDFPEQIELTVPKIRREIKQIQVLLSDLTSYSLLSEEKTVFHPKPTSVFEIFNNSVERFNGIALQNQVSLRMIDEGASEFVNIDPDRLFQLLGILLNNAIRYAGQKGSVDVVLHNRVGLSFSVINTGKKIPNEYLPHLFERFFRASDSYLSGTGLGLNIAKQLVDGMNGNISVASVENRTEFSVEIKCS